MATVYKILFEVKLLHEYYLTNQEGASIFERSTQPEKNNFLEDFFRINRSTILSDVDIALPKFSKQIFSEYKLRLIPSYFGFKVAIAVQPKKLSDKSIVFKPIIPLPDDLPLVISIYKKNPSFDLFTNTRFTPSFTGIYFFTNRQLTKTKSFPTLSEPIPTYNPGSRYEQGELSLDFGSNTQAFYLDANGNEQWLPVTGFGYVNENDRMLVNQRFFYNFDPTDQVQQVEFKLKDKTGNELRNILLKNPSGIQRSQIDFSSLQVFASANPLAGPYNLEISGDNGLNRTHQLMFTDVEVSLSNCWGLISIYPRSENSSFNLLDDEGFIRERIQPDNIKIKPDFFELRFKSRFTYWRYVNENKKKIRQTTELDKYLTYDSRNGFYVTGSLRNSTLIAANFKSASSSRFLPTPKSFENIKKDEKGRLIAEVTVPKSALFDII